LDFISVFQTKQLILSNLKLSHCNRG